METIFKLLLLITLFSLALAQNFSCVLLIYIQIKLPSESVIKQDDLVFDNFTVACAQTNYTEGWYIFNVTGNTEHFSNEIVSYYAGFLEGYLYSDIIDNHYTNIFKTLLGGQLYNNQTIEFMNQQLDYMYFLSNNSIIDLTGFSELGGSKIDC